MNILKKLFLQLLAGMLLSYTIHGCKKSPDVIDLFAQDNREIITAMVSLPVKQDNGWECGYFATFHAFILKDNVKNSSQVPVTKETYEAWLKKALTANPGLSSKHTNKEKLGSSDVRELIKTIINRKNVPSNICIFEDANIDEILPHDRSILDPIDSFHKNYKQTNEPFYLIAHDSAAKHWITVVLFDGTYNVIDSLNTSKDHQDYKVVKKIHKLFHESQLPTSFQYQLIKKQIKVDLGNIKHMDEVKKNAIETHNFTEETFACLLTRVIHDKKRTRETQAIEIE